MTSPELGQRAWRRTGKRRHRLELLLYGTGLVWWALAFSVLLGGPPAWTLVCALAAAVLTLGVLVRLVWR